MPDPGTAEISSSITVIASNIMDVKKQVVVEETELPVMEPNGQKSQQLTDISNVNNNNTIKEAILQAGSGIECEASRARVTGVVEEVKQVMVQETVVKQTLAENMQTSFSPSENICVVDQSGGGNESDNTGNASVDNAIQVLNKNVKPSNYPDCSVREENVSRKNSGQPTGTSEVNDGCIRNLVNNSDLSIPVQENPILKNVVPVCQESSDVLQEVDRNFKQMQAIETGNLDNEQHTQELVLQTEEKSKKKGGNAELNVQNKGDSSNFDVSSDRSKEGEMVREHINVKTARNEKQIAEENSKDECKANLGCNNETTEKNVTSKMDKSDQNEESCDRQQSSGLEKTNIANQNIQTSSTSPENTVVMDQNGRNNRHGKTGNMDLDRTVQVRDSDVKPSLCIPVQEDPILKNVVPVCQESSNVLQEVEKIFQEMQTVGTGNLDDEQRTQELVLQREEESKKKGGNAELNVQNKGDINNFGVSSDRSKEGEMVREHIHVKTARNDKQIAEENSKDECKANLGYNNETTEKNFTSKMEKSNQNEESCDRQQSSGLEKTNIANQNIQTSSTSPENTVVMDQNGRNNELGKKGITDPDRTVQVRDSDVKPSLCIPEQEDPILKNVVPVCQESSDVLQEVEKIFQEMQTVGTGNLDDEQRTQELVLQREEKSKKKGGNAELNVQNKGDSSNFDVSSDRNKEGEMVREHINVKTTRNDKQIAEENSKDECKTNLGYNNETTEKNVTSKMEKSNQNEECCDRQQSSGLEKTNIANQNIQTSSTSPENTVVMDQNGRNNKHGKTGNTGADRTVQVRDSDVKPSLCIPVQEDPVLKNVVPVCQESSDVLQEVERIFQEMQTVGTGNLDDEQRTQELVLQREEKSKGKGSRAGLNVKNKGDSKNFDLSSDVRKEDKTVRTFKCENS